MTRIYPGDLVAIQGEGCYYYALILDRVRLFGGNWVYVFHETSEVLLPPSVLLGSPKPGFHAFVDFIWAKREGRITQLAKKTDIRRYNTVQRLKGTHLAFTGKATIWFIYDMNFQEVKRVAELSEEEKTYPQNECINDLLMAEYIKQKWTPNKDPRI